jgi:ligand-binding sensor domain-containing protein
MKKNIRQPSGNELNLLSRPHFMRILQTAIIICLLTLSARAQEPGQSYAFMHLDINNGLASNHVSAILQDHKGFIWIASTALQRYDGSNLVTIASFDKVPGSIYYDDICLCEDKQGRIWMGAPDNIRYYDPITSQVKVLKIDVPGSLNCSHVLQDHAGTIWLTTQEGLLQYNEKESRFVKPTNINESDRHDMYSAIVEDNKGNLWISGQKGIYLLDAKRQYLYSAANNPSHIPLLEIQSSAKQLFIDRSQRIWVGARHGDSLFCYHPDTNTMDAYAFRLGSKGNMVTDIIEDAEDQIWIATEAGGMYRFDEKAHQFSTNITADNSDDRSLHYNFEVNCFLNDRDGRLWIGTDHGVNILDFPGPSFRVLDHRTQFAGNKRLPKAEVTGVFQDSRSNIYAGYWGNGFALFNDHLKLFTAGNNLQQQLPEDKGLVWSFEEMPDGKVLVGQENGWLSVFDPVKEQFTARYHPEIFGDQTLMTMLAENDTTVWIGMYKKGLIRWNPQQQQFYGYPGTPGNPKRPVTVMDLALQGDSIIWLATSDAGLIRFDRQKQHSNVAYIMHDGSLTVSNMTCLSFVNDSILAAGTDHGLWLFNINTNKVQPLKINGALFDEWVLSMQKDWPDDLWMTTQYGFYRFNSKKLSLETFVQSGDIVGSQRKVRRRIVTLQDGRLLIGAADHFVVFDPAKLKTAPPPPDVTIINLKAGDSTVYPTNTPVNLSYRQNFLTIEFKSLQYRHESIRYLYQLEGLEEDWVKAENVLVARYTNLPPGDYTFRVRSVNSAGTFSAGITTLYIHIKPAFWQTSWFKVLCFICIAGMIYLYIRLRINGVKKEARRRNAIQQKIAQLEMKALRAQMNPHFIFNALNSIQTFMMKSETEQALSYLGRFARLIRNVLDNSQLNSIPVSKELRMLENYLELEKLRFTDHFDCKITVDPELDPDFTEIPTMILQPFVENAIWHGLLYKKEKGYVKIAFEKRENTVLCIVEDDGIGREGAKERRQAGDEHHHSRGLQITRDRLALYNKRFDLDATFDIEDLYDQEGLPIGTRVHIWFPLEES